jgi:hypothetical protein
MPFIFERGYKMAGVLIIGGFVLAIILLFASLMKMASRDGENNG